MFAVVYHRHFRPAVDVCLTERAPKSNELVLRVRRGSESKDYAPHDVFSNGLSAADLVVAWTDPERRRQLGDKDFIVASFTEPGPQDLLAAKAFIGQKQRA